MTTFTETLNEMHERTKVLVDRHMNKINSNKHPDPITFITAFKKHIRRKIEYFDLINDNFKRGTLNYTIWEKAFSEAYPQDILFTYFNINIIPLEVFNKEELYGHYHNVLRKKCVTISTDISLYKHILEELDKYDVLEKLDDCNVPASEANMKNAIVNEILNMINSVTPSDLYVTSHTHKTIHDGHDAYQISFNVRGSDFYLAIYKHDRSAPSQHDFQHSPYGVGNQPYGSHNPQFSQVPYMGYPVPQNQLNISRIEDGTILVNNQPFDVADIESILMDFVEEITYTFYWLDGNKTTTSKKGEIADILVEEGIIDWKNKLQVYTKGKDARVLRWDADNKVWKGF